MDNWIDGKREEMIEELRKWCSIRSVQEAPLPGMPFGKGVSDCLEYVLSFCEKMGFTVKNFDGYAGEAEYGEGSETMGILCHLDVVPEGEGWEYPPYGGTIKDGYIYARGCSDNKCAGINAVYAIRALIETGAVFKRKVRIIFGCNEESGWECMKHYKAVREMPDFAIVPDGSFPIINTEKGIMNIRLSGKGKMYPIISISAGTRPNVVPDSADALLDLPEETVYEAAKAFDEAYPDVLTCEKYGEYMRVHAKGISAHGAWPDGGKNAASYLIRFLSSLGLKGIAGSYTGFLSEYLAFHTDGAGLGIKMTDKPSGPLTMNLGVLKADENGFYADIDIRYPVTYKGKDIFETVKRAAAYRRVSAEMRDHKEPVHVPEEHFLIQKLLKVYEEQTGEKGAVKSMGGGTYARTMKNAVVFGPGREGHSTGAHEKNEHLLLDDLIANTKIYAHAIYELACKD